MAHRQGQRPRGPNNASDEWMSPTPLFPIWSFYAGCLDLLVQLLLHLTAESDLTGYHKDAVRELKKEVISLRAWGEGYDGEEKLGSVLETLHELRPGVVGWLVEIAAILTERLYPLLDCVADLQHMRCQVRFLRQQAQVFAEMVRHAGDENDLVSYFSESDEAPEGAEDQNVRSDTNVRSPQALEFYEMDFSGMTVDLRCCTSALMEFLPAMDQAWEIMQWVDPRSLKIAAELQPSPGPPSRLPTGLPAGHRHSGSKHWWRLHFWRTGITQIAEALSSLELGGIR
ncbi:MAG: hypothetical protein M1839_002761 [Geoglossum umbratile]|nr:MAG: hypothetical protein M1839_002761 [Geoglossum umbratile]